MSRILQFRRPVQRCKSCREPLPPQQRDPHCKRCFAWDRHKRALEAFLAATRPTR